MTKKDLSKFEEKIGYRFQEKDLLQNALTHSSYANEKHLPYEKNNERLEFLGDAVLELVSSDFIFHEQATAMEGKMSKFRASLVCERSLAQSAREIDLGSYLFLGKGEAATGGAGRDSILSDAFEAVIGAIYLDAGMKEASRFIHQYVLSDIEHKTLFYDSKTILQEMVQSHGTNTLCYHLLEEKGPDHCKEFVISCCLGDRQLGVGTGRSKKLAEQEAAYQAILALRNK